MTENERQPLPSDIRDVPAITEQELLDQMSGKLTELGNLLRSPWPVDFDLDSYQKNFSQEFSLILADYVLCLEGNEQARQKRSDVAHSLREPLFHVLGKLEIAALSKDQQSRDKNIEEVLGFIEVVQKAINYRHKEINQ